MRLLRDGVLVAEGSYTDILALFHKLHGYSLSHGLAHEGYMLEDAQGTE